MIDGFIKVVEHALPSEEQLKLCLLQQTAQDWQPLADVFTAKLPEFDGILTLPSSAPLAELIATARGVPLVVAQYTETDNSWALPHMRRLNGEFIILTDHLQDGFIEVQLLVNALEEGLSISSVCAVIERTNLGARKRLKALGTQVRAVVQVADTPLGLVFERRSPDRWTPTIPTTPEPTTTLAPQPHPKDNKNTQQDNQNNQNNQDNQD